MLKSLKRNGRGTYSAFRAWAVLLWTGFVFCSCGVLPLSRGKYKKTSIGDYLDLCSIAVACFLPREGSARKFRSDVRHGEMVLRWAERMLLLVWFART